ncbi:alpha-amylase family glycosyl hydrolase [Modestobacter sp. VKM Ac-2983]|uniref:alpha-amylase family glycosyl hydrolase n=1 Tax=Modestobacter sp. VKM Ac-2983 TaxID=3004137 RepID=UPI0022AB61A3|nr:alpha-amylase family glycosyl hydrolase [Modestobacter sp. VKM Ac-2983]MCZ2805715.1 alpha-amylase family glycosyl hydrolase [Modestobacter sp. VKM Ac-2983]
MTGPRPGEPVPAAPGTPPWWRTAVVYQLYPRSFADASGDGIGDLEGIRAHLDHLSWLGVDALWLSPIYPSPMADAGYDVSDHRDVDPVFGDLETFDRLVAEVHARGMRLMLDWVPNHTSDQHPWFLDSRSSRDSPRRSWYLWRDGTPDAPPNNWLAQFTGGPAWTWDERTGQWYLHLFLPEQPDLDWSEPAVREAMHEVLRFWLRRGVDGFRADVVHLIGKDPALPDHPPELVGTNIVHSHDLPVTHELLRGIRAVLDEFPGDRAMVGEVNLRSPALVAPYHGAGDELHLAFNFLPMLGPWDADFWRSAISETLAALTAVGAWPTWVLSNHDNPRHRTRYGGSEQRARAAAVLLLTLPGTPFLYAGEELGLEDAAVAPEQQVDPGGRDGCRAPVPWTPDPGHGWPTEPWLPFPPAAAARSAAAQRADPTSVLALYRRLLAARRRSPALHRGSWTAVPAPDGVLAYERRAEGDRRVVAVNFRDAPADLLLTESTTVEVASTGRGEGTAWSGTLQGSEGVVLIPTPT